MRIFESKKLRFAAVSILLTSLLFLLSIPPYSTQIFWVILPSLIAVVATYFVLVYPSGIEVATLLLLPLLLTFGATVNQYFFPNFHLVFKVGSWVSFFFLFYVLLLSLNIFRVERMEGESIPLEKAAKPAVFLFSFLSMFLLLTVLYRLDLGVIVNTLAVFFLGFVLSVNFFWFLTLSDLIERRFFLGAAAVGLGVAQLSIALSFFPWEAFLRGLTEGVFFYAVLGVARAYFEKHLRYRIVFEYIVLSVIVFIFVRFFS